MIPLTDSSRRPERFPAVTLALIVVNVMVFGLELLGGDAFVRAWSATPADIMAGRDWLTLLTAMFMHGGIMHILGNMVFFWAFAPVVEDAMGRSRFLGFYLLGGLAAFVAQIAVDPASTIPNLGASGAIAAVMGAFLVWYPRDRIKTLVPIGPFLTLMSLPASLLIGIWLLTQMLNEVGALVEMQSGGVAYVAHIGGALFGAASAALFVKPRAPNTGVTPWPPPSWFGERHL
jgi:membrane associated rhomboid family serine protease